MSQFIGILNPFDYKSTEWSIFKCRLVQFLKVNKVEETCKSAILITHLSDETYRLVRNLAYPKEVDELSFSQLVNLLDSHFKQRQTSFADRAKFYGAVRSPGESLGDWAARLRGLASYCDFGAALESNVTDRFVLGLGPGPERDKLFEQKPSVLTFGKAVEVAEQAESARAAKSVTSVMVKEEPIFRASFGGASGSGRAASGGGAGRPGAGGPACTVCGMRNHDVEKCRFRGYKCNICGKKGHLKKVCAEKVKNSRLNNINGERDENKKNGGEQICDECYNFNLRYVGEKPIRFDVLLGKTSVTMELDTGSGYCVMSEEMYKKLFHDYALNNCNLKMCMYDGHKIAPLGYFVVNACFENQSKSIKIFVIENGGPPLLGRDFMSAFNLAISTNCARINKLSKDSDIEKLLEQYSDLWKD